MLLRRAVSEDLSSIMAVIEDGIQVLAKQNLPQWQNGYGPSRKKITEDIDAGRSYVLVAAGEIVATATLVDGIDDAYENIDGNWQPSDGYLAIHRFAVSSAVAGQGLGTQFLKQLITEAVNLGFRDIRIDTHPQNKGMQKVIQKAGFLYRGTVHFKIPHGERFAYQIVISR